MTARQRLRRATRESLATPAFSSPIDCTPWVVGGLWPAELSNPTPETASLAQYLEADLRRIVSDANDELKMLKRSGMPDPARQAAEARVIDGARASAVRRVESTMRQLHAVRAEATGPPPPHPLRPRVEPPARPDLERTQILPVTTNPFAQAAARALPHQPTPAEAEANGRHHAAESRPVDSPVTSREQGVADDDAAAASALDQTQIIPVITEAPPPPVVEPETGAGEVAQDAGNGRHHVSQPEVPGEQAVQAEKADVAETEAFPAAVTSEEPVAEPPRQGLAMESSVEPVAETPQQELSAPRRAEELTDSGRHHVVAAEAAPESPDEAGSVAESPATEAVPAVVPAKEPVAAPPRVAEPAAGAQPPAPGRPEATRQEAPATTPSARPPIEKRSPSTTFDADRLNRLLEFVVRQEPRLSWAVAQRADGTTVLVTDLAHGWIPSGITLPDGVRLLEPERRTGKVAALIGDAPHVVTYTPGDSLRRSAGFATTKSSLEPRRLPVIDDLAGALSGAIRRHEGLPRIVQRLADAAAAGVAVVDQEVDVLRVHLDTARYQLLIQQTRVDQALLHKCLLMAATEGIASGDTVSANYHLAWYQKLAAPAS